METEGVLSVIVPAYNARESLGKCLDSILAQSLTDYEILLVNDGSSDNSLEICRKYEAKYDFIHVLDQPNRGVSAARNNGMRASKGKYICFMDADDFYTVDFAKSFYEICEREQLDVIRGFYHFFDEDTQTFRDEPEKKLSYYNKVLSGGEFLDLSIREHANEVVPVGGFFRREHLLENDIWFPEGIIFEEDQIFFLEALLKSPTRVMQTPVEFYAYRKRAGSATTTPTLKKAQDVGFIVGKELALASQMTDASVQKAAKCFAGNSFFQLTCIYGRLPKEQRKEARRICNFKTKFTCALHAGDRYQQMKIALFTFAPWLVDLIYDLRKTDD